MKRLLLILILAFTVSEAKPCMTDIYFGNGVWNTEKQAKYSRKILRKFMLHKAVTRLDPQKEGVDYVFKYAYNPSYGKREDLIETFWQLKESGQISDGYFGAVYAALTWEEDTKFYNKLSEVIREYKSDITTMFTLYKTSSFDKHHNVLLVAHSQGNLFGNKMYTLLNDEQKVKFRMVSVGTPADHVMEANQTSPYVTLIHDPVKCSVHGDDMQALWNDRDKNGCATYRIDDTTGGYHTIDYVANHTYDNGWLCTRYKMDSEITTLLKNLKAN